MTSVIVILIMTTALTIIMMDTIMVIMMTLVIFITIFFSPIIPYIPMMIENIEEDTLHQDIIITELIAITE